MVATVCYRYKWRQADALDLPPRVLTFFATESYKMRALEMREMVLAFHSEPKNLMSRLEEEAGMNRKNGRGNPLQNYMALASMLGDRKTVEEIENTILAESVLAKLGYARG